MKSASSHTCILISFLFFSMYALVRPASAQDLDNVTITGRVMDQNHASVPGVEVSIKLIATGGVRSVITDLEGRYRLIQLPPGSYSVTLRRIGFAPLEQAALTVIAGQTLQLDFTLLPREIVADAVVIVGNESSKVDTTRTVVGATIDRNQLDSIPLVTRSPLDLVFTLPGVTEEPLSTRDLAEDRNSTPAITPEEAGTFALAGAPAYSNNLTIDGLDNNDDRAARERFTPPLDAVEEVQVITNQFSAEYGRASGGRVNLRTRSGSSRFHGRAFYFFRDEALNANTFHNNSLGLSRLPLQEHDYGLSLGGPLGSHEGETKPTHFFVAFERDKVLDNALIDTLVPVEQNPLFSLPAPTLPMQARLESVTSPSLAAEVAPFVASVNTPQRSTSLVTRVDHEFSQTHGGSLVYQAGRFRNLRQFGGGTRLAEALQARTRNSDAISYSDNIVLSSAVVNQTRLQYLRLAPSLTASGGQKPVVLININDSLESNDPGERSGTVVAGSSTAGATDRSEVRWQIQELVSAIYPSHSLTLGSDVQRIRSTFIDLSDFSGTFNFASAGDFLANTPSRFRQNFLGSSTQTNSYVGVFVQDQWRPKENLTVSYGLRYERESILQDLNNFGPRFSLAYDPFKSAKTVLRFGLGIFYNRVLLRTIDDFTVGAKQLFFDTNALRDSVTGNLLSADQRRAFIASSLQFPNVLSGDSPFVKQFASLDSGFSRRLDSNLRIPESYQGNLGFEREIGRGFVVETNVTFTRGIHLWREFNANAPHLPDTYRSFTDYLASRDFPNFRPATNAARPLYNASGAGQLVRFVLNPVNPSNPNAVTTVVEFGVPVSLINLNSFSSGTAVEVALAALNKLRTDPGPRRS
ncbi:MAG TPA: TonB-dependent receptor [Pyrinomonadaceae bacterium]